jgi:hypothetical protein
MALAIYALHSANHVLGGTAHDLLWICNLAPGLLAIGCLARVPTLAAIPMLWLSVGTPLWLLDALAGGAVIPTGALSHVGGLTLSVLAVRGLGLPRGTWLKAVAAVLFVMALSRIATPPEHNVNLAFSVRAGWEPYFSSYPLYFGMLVAVFTSVFFVVERLFVRITSEAR